MLALGALYLCLGAVTRVVLWLKFGAAADVPVADLPLLMLAGLLNDAVESLYLVTPLVLYLLLVPDRWYRTRASRALLAGGFVLTLSALIYTAAAEFYFFEEFDARFNLVAFDYLRYPAEVFIDIWQAYPVLKALFVAVALAGTLTWMLRHRLLAGADAATTLRLRLGPFAVHLALVIAAIAWYPTDALSRSSNRVENELAQNGYSSFFRAAATNRIDYRDYYASRDPASNLKLLASALGAGGGEFTRLAEGRLDRRFPARADGLGRLNVVVVSSESFGARFSRLYGSERDLTPNFDAYAKRGIWFSRTYASGTRTVRGLEALTASFPPIPTVSIVRRPGNEGIATWGRVMRDLGYDTSFLYGGYGYFDNMNAFYAGNGFEVLDRTAIGKVRFENIWGVADEDLFDLELKHCSELYARGKPFFSIVMTTSNHKPFTFRPGLEGLGIPEEGGGRKAGVKYADYALGYFLREAREAALVRRHDLRRRRRPWCPRVRQGRHSAQFLRDPADDLRAEASRAAARGRAHDADRHRPDRARAARPPVRGAVLRAGRAARASRIAGGAVQPRSRRRDLPRRPARRPRHGRPRARLPLRPQSRQLRARGSRSGTRCARHRLLPDGLGPLQGAPLRVTRRLIVP